MITHVTYEEARFASETPARGAVDVAAAAGWTVSDYNVGRGGRVTILFRKDIECLSPESEHATPRLPELEQGGGRRRSVTAGLGEWFGKVRVPARRFGRGFAASPLSTLGERNLRR